VSFSLDPGETLALVGESGCGKSLTALGVANLLPPAARREQGEILLDGRPVAALGEEAWRAIRGRRIALVFQEPQSALNPVMRLGDQVAEGVRAHTGASWRSAREAAVDALARVGLPDPKSRALAYPHELSGGMKQRAVLAMALAGNPGVLLADEPTTALDVTVQAQILGLLRQIRDSTGLSILLVTHDLGVVAEAADRVAVMYAGRIVETGPVREVLGNPAHPYTRGLKGSRPQGADTPLKPIPGQVPSPGNWPAGCPFHPRCEMAEELCTLQVQLLKYVKNNSYVACHKFMQ
jgi:oligopeptide/dipeptide ABC transporter ATP-binding protein